MLLRRKLFESCRIRFWILPNVVQLVQVAVFNGVSVGLSNFAHRFATFLGKSLEDQVIGI